MFGHNKMVIYGYVFSAHSFSKVSYYSWNLLDGKAYVYLSH